MSVIMTAAGEALKARLQAEGKPLVIDTFVFAHIPNLDPTEQLTPGCKDCGFLLRRGPRGQVDLRSAG